MVETKLQFLGAALLALSFVGAKANGQWEGIEWEVFIMGLLLSTLIFLFRTN